MSQLAKFDQLRNFVLRDVRELLVSSRKWGLNTSSKTQKPDESVVTLLDVLVQYLTCVQLTKLFPGDRLIGEETIDFSILQAQVRRHAELQRTYGKILQEQGPNPLSICVPKLNKHTKTQQRQNLDLSHSAAVWVQDPIDGTADFTQGGVDFCFSLARLEPIAKNTGIRSQQTLWVPTYALISAPCFPGLSPLLPPFPLLQLINGQVTLWSSSSSSSSSSLSSPVSIHSSPLRFSIRNSYQKELPSVQSILRRNFPDSLIKTASCPAVMQLLQACVGHVAAFHNPRMHLWDHAAGVGIIHALGGAAIRDNGEEWQGYTLSDLEDASSDCKFPLLVSGNRGFLLQLRRLLHPGLPDLPTLSGSPTSTNAPLVSKL
eukprot:gb/GEZN01007765.1/.p1 GENE.gb/GEZN01007765.1/~~gb/GEZN01007765.1/.p1  ORF type:complete len:374 (-),score=42.83 gb/GEZN01007765.1/:348-1469(-)